MIAWVTVPNATSRRVKSASSKGALKPQWGAHNVNNMGPHSNGGPKILWHRYTKGWRVEIFAKNYSHQSGVDIILLLLLLLLAIICKDSFCQSELIPAMKKLQLGLVAVGQQPVLLATMIKGTVITFLWLLANPSSAFAQSGICI